MMRITDPQQRAVLAMLIFNKLRKDGIIARLIANMPKDMRYINVDPEFIADHLYMADFYTGLDFYTPFWPWSAAYAKVNSGNYSRMWLSTRKLDRVIESLAGSIAHEWGHCLEFWWKKHMTSNQYFNHGDNNRKDDTFQYQLGRRVKEYVGFNRAELLRSIGYTK
jgi:hypothetical protein